MKKILTALLFMSFLFTATMANAAPCPVEKDCHCRCGNCAEMHRPCPQDFEKHKKLMENKRLEFEKRLCLTPEQKAKLDSLHEKKMKKMRQYDAKIRKHEKQIGKLMQKKIEAGKACIDEFEATLSEEQKCELNKIKEQHKLEMKSRMPKSSCEKCGPDCKCDCPCHKPHHPDCKKPMHE